MKEEWKDVIDWEGWYKVSSLGQVRSIDRVIETRNGSRKYKGQILRPGYQRGYQIVHLRRPGITITPKVHCLMLESFVGPRPGNLEGCHNNGNKLDNNIQNLRWDSKSENMKDSVKHGTHRCPMRKVIRSDGQIFESVAEAARQTSSLPTAICNALNGRCKTSKGYKWSYI